MIFVETPTFTKRVLALLDDESYAGLQTWLAKHPDAGDVIRASGGLRKDSLGGQRPRQTRRGADNLLLVDGQRSHLDAVRLSEK